MRTLLDTCVLAEIRRAGGELSVIEAVDSLGDDEAYISAITVGEIVKGIELIPAGRKKQELTVWLATLQSEYGSRILTVDAAVAETWGRITARAQVGGTQLPVSDGLIAATALTHGLHVMTRNVRHFNIAGVPTINPWPQ